MKRDIHLVTGDIGHLKQGIKCTRDKSKVHQVTRFGGYHVDLGYPNQFLHQLLKERKVI